MQTAPTTLNITDYSCWWLWVFCLMTFQESEEMEAICCSNKVIFGSEGSEVGTAVVSAL